jgi:glycosyltransferase involved in cell wall biosynthesis
MEHSQGMDLLKCRHIAFPILCGTRHPGFRKIGNCLSLGRIAFAATQEIRRQRVEAVIIIIQGRYYLAAVLASWVTATPLIAVVHDNIFSSNVGPGKFTATMLRRWTKGILRHAAHIYVVSPEMRRLVFAECGQEAEVQLPSAAMPAREAPGQFDLIDSGCPAILFAGTVGYTVRDSVDLLANLIATGKLKEYGLPKPMLYLCTSMTEAEIQKQGWDQPGIVVTGWLSQAELARQLFRADILFLPYSFSTTSQQAVKTAFPSKAADYMAAGKPIVVFGPRNSSLVRYASEEGFAEIVTEFSEAALARAIQKVALSASYSAKLAARALEVFSVNHDIRCQRDKFYITLDRITRTRSKP